MGILKTRKIWYNETSIINVSHMVRKECWLMGTILPKKQMTEEDIKLQYITPAVTPGERDKIIFRQQQIGL